MSIIQPTNPIIKEKNPYSGLSEEHLFIDVAKYPEENIELLILKDISNNKKKISKINIIYELLIKIKKFKEFIRIYNFNQELIKEILTIGELKSYKKDECIFTKNSIPEYYFLILTGEAIIQNSNEVFLPGNFFGEKYLFINKRYRINSYSKAYNTILLLIQKEYFNNNLKNKILKGKDRIKMMLLKNFKIFRMIERKLLEIYTQKMVKIFPSYEEIIISNKDLADSVFLIYEGSCVLNSVKQGDLLILEKGDIFGNESLDCINEEGIKKKVNYKYNVINKSPNSIIFKFLINIFSKYVINGMKTYLAKYFQEREENIKNISSNVKDIKISLKKEYDLFKRPINQKEIIEKYCFNENILTNEKIQKSFNNVLFELKLNRKDGKYKKKLISYKSKFINKKSLFLQTYLKNNKIKNSFNMKKKSGDITFKNKYKSINSTSKRKIRKLVWFSENKISKSQYYNKNKKQTNFHNYNKFLKANSHINSSKLLTISDNNNNNNNSSFYITSINNTNKNNDTKSNINNDNNKFIISPIRAISNNDRTINTEPTPNKNKQNKRIINSAYSSNRWSTSAKSSINVMSIRKQIETYGCSILDTITYFNNGLEDSFLKRNFSTKSKKRIINNKRKLCYQTQKYNIPLFVLCDKKEKIKFPAIANI